MHRIVLDNLSNPSDVSITHEDGILYYVLYGFSTMEKRIEIHLTKEGAEADILGILIGREGECSISTLQHHQAPNTKSDLLVKTVLSGDAHFSYDGLIKIDRDAQKSNAYQRNENILLSSRARVETKPELEILANDVRCTHGATIGRLNEEELFYLQSRGIEEKNAATMILRGFIEHVIARIPAGNQRRLLDEALDSFLSGI